MKLYTLFQFIVIDGSKCIKLHVVIYAQFFIFHGAVFSMNEY